MQRQSPMFLWLDGWTKIHSWQFATLRVAPTFHKPSPQDRLRAMDDRPTCPPRYCIQIVSDQHPVSVLALSEASASCLKPRAFSAMFSKPVEFLEQFSSMKSK